jgi:hypothetical protein
MNSIKIDKRKEKLDFLYNRQQSWNPKQAITLKHLIAYNNLRTYINLKGIIGMLVTGCHVWNHAYEHDNWVTLIFVATQRQRWIGYFFYLYLTLNLDDTFFLFTPHDIEIIPNLVCKPCSCSWFGICSKLPICTSKLPF